MATIIAHVVQDIKIYLNGRPETYHLGGLNPGNLTCIHFLLEQYHSQVWVKQHWRGVPCLKFAFDIFNYQEIIYDLQPSLIIEIGTAYGGSALMFSDFLKINQLQSRVLTIDINDENISEKLRNTPNIKIVTADSTSDIAKTAIQESIQQFPGRIFAIIDGDHHQDKVLQEMLMLNQFLKSGDYLVVEDGILNRMVAWNELDGGPAAAIEKFFELYPNDFYHDYERERKHGITYALNGYLIKKSTT